MTDNGFKYLVQRFEAIYIQHGQGGRQVEVCMHFDFSKNLLSESAITCFADILSKFNAFRSLNMSSLGIRKGKDGCLLDLAKAISHNTSLVELDLRGNVISGQVAARILQALADNFVISVIKLDIQLRKIPESFSSYPLQSMF